jgi:hypothetical protein
MEFEKWLENFFEGDNVDNDEDCDDGLDTAWY